MHEKLYGKVRIAVQRAERQIQSMEFRGPATVCQVSVLYVCMPEGAVFLISDAA